VSEHGADGEGLSGLGSLGDRCMCRAHGAHTHAHGSALHRDLTRLSPGRTEQRSDPPLAREDEGRMLKGAKQYNTGCTTPNVPRVHRTFPTGAYQSWRMTGCKRAHHQLALHRLGRRSGNAQCDSRCIDAAETCIDGFCNTLLGLILAVPTTKRDHRHTRPIVQLNLQCCSRSTVSEAGEVSAHGRTQAHAHRYGDAYARTTTTVSEARRG
jgi:hypothetical protein